MSNPVYTTELLRLAASLSDPHPLEREDGSADLRSQTCGSRVRIAVQLDGERRVEEVSLRVHACAFGQASASLVEQHCVGRKQEDVANALNGLSGWLSGDTDEATAWPGLEALRPARDRKARHAAILLPFRALLGAIEGAP